MNFSFYAGVMYYTKAILLDLKSIFNRIDNLARLKDNSTELAMLTYFTEAIDLHTQNYKHVPFLFSRFSEIFSRFQFAQFYEIFVCSCMQQLADLMSIIIFVTVTPTIVSMCTSLLLFDMGSFRVHKST